MSDMPMSEDETVDAMLRLAKSQGRPLSRSRIQANVRRWTKSYNEILAAVQTSRTLKQAAKKLGVTRARVSALCDSRGISWYDEKKGGDL